MILYVLIVDFQELDVQRFLWTLTIGTLWSVHQPWRFCGLRRCLSSKEVDPSVPKKYNQYQGVLDCNSFTISSPHSAGTASVATLAVLACNAWKVTPNQSTSFFQKNPAFCKTHRDASHCPTKEIPSDLFKYLHIPTLSQLTWHINDHKCSRSFLNPWAFGLSIS